MTAAIAAKGKIKTMTTSTPKEQIGMRGQASAVKARPTQQEPAVAPSKAKPALKAGSTQKAGGPRKLGGIASQGSKTAKILGLLDRPGGVTLKALVKATGWQAHSVRGFLSGTLKKKMGMVVESLKSADGERTYRIPPK